LRPGPDKKAVLYEVVTRDTADEGIAARRRLRPAPNNGDGAPPRKVIRPVHLAPRTGEP